MAQNAQEKELSVWGIAGGLRTGLITFILALLIMAVIYLYAAQVRAEREKYEDQAQRYREMIEYMKPARDRMNNVADKVDTAVIKAIATSAKVDSLSTELLNNQLKTHK